MKSTVKKYPQRFVHLQQRIHQQVPVQAVGRILACRRVSVYLQLVQLKQKVKMRCGLNEQERLQ